MPYAQGDMKELNRREVFDLLSRRGEASRVEIHRALGISTPTVLKIISFLSERHIITAAGEEKTVRGRPPCRFRFDPDSILSVGVSYDGREARAVVANYRGEVKQSAAEPAGPDFDALMADVLPRLLPRLLSGLAPELDPVCGVGICLPGSVDTGEARVLLGPLANIRMRRPSAESVQNLSAALGLPVYLFNDANAAATGEYLLRRLHGDDLIYISAGEGIGAGIILDGKLRTGKRFSTGEIAHMVFDPDFMTDIQKPGWFEAQLSEASLHEKFPGDPYGAEAVHYVARHLALVVANLCNTLDVGTFILGGSLTGRLGGALMDETAEYVERLCLLPATLDAPCCANPTLPGAAFMASQRELDGMLADGAENATSCRARKEADYEIYG